MACQKAVGRNVQRPHNRTTRVAKLLHHSPDRILSALRPGPAPCVPSKCSGGPQPEVSAGRSPLPRGTRPSKWATAPGALRSESHHVREEGAWFSVNFMESVQRQCLLSAPSSVQWAEGEDGEEQRGSNCGGLLAPSSALAPSLCALEALMLKVWF